MREEAERVVREEGWTKAALNNMPNVRTPFTLFVLALTATQWSCSAASYQRTASASPTARCIHEYRLACRAL
jgi:hypothetical protein